MGRATLRGAPAPQGLVLMEGGLTCSGPTDPGPQQGGTVLRGQVPGSPMPSPSCSPEPSSCPPGWMGEDRQSPAKGEAWPPPPTGGSGWAAWKQVDQSPSLNTQPSSPSPLLLGTGRGGGEKCSQALCPAALGLLGTATHPLRAPTRREAGQRAWNEGLRQLRLRPLGRGWALPVPAEAVTGGEQGRWGDGAWGNILLGLLAEVSFPRGGRGFLSPPAHGAGSWKVL